MSRIRIFACYHQNALRFESDFITPLQVGRALSSEKLDMPGDDTGTHISEKNCSYAELTGHYWVWKNILPNCPEEWIGLCHYRRFIDIQNIAPGTITTVPIARFPAIFSCWTEEMALQQVKDHDIITAMPHALPFCNTYEHYCVVRSRRFMDMTIHIIAEKFSEYRLALQATLAAKQMNICNTFLMRKEWLNRYYEWLFAILDELEVRANKNPALREQWMHAQKTRETGHLAERLLNVWCAHQRLNSSARIIDLPGYFLKESNPPIITGCKTALRNAFRLYALRLSRSNRPPL